MENKVNEITLNIPLPKAVDGSAITGAILNNSLKVTEIDIVYKESDGQAVQVVDTLLVNNQFETTYTGSIISYVYQSLKPYKTLPEADLIRVYDKVPVKAFSQEISGNRIIYGNFQDKHTPLFQNLNGQLTPQLDYKIGAFDKSTFTPGTTSSAQSTTSIVEYPNSTLKQNRNYQVGIVVSDRYGRSSTVLLSQFADASITSGGGTFAASTHYHPYRNDADTPVASWPGDALKILFNSPISTPSPIPAGSGIPGLYIGAGNNYNPLGWYSYKVVVKQFEQEYYNVYLPGILNGPPNGVSTDDPAGTVGFVTLINDNVNKVPRDLSEVGPEQKQFRSSVQLFGRVTPDAAGPPTYNKQFYPGNQSNTVITIAEEDDLFGQNVTDIYDTTSNPLVGRISQIASNSIGSIGASGTYNFLLSVFETEPTESRLDIYYETSTSGLISELNTAIESTTNVVTGAIGNVTVDFNENQSHANGNVDILPSTSGEGWAPTDVNSLGEAVNQDLPANRLTASITGVTSLSEEIDDKITFFTVVEVPPTSSPYNNQDQATWYRYKIQSTKDFYYSLEAGTEKVYNIVVNFTDVSGNPAGSAGFDVPLANTSPIFKTYTIPNQPSVNIDPVPSNLTLQFTAGFTGKLVTFAGVNGTADANLNTEDLSWSITSPVNQNVFSINAAGELSTTQDLTGPYPITITLTDAGGPTDATNLQLTALFGNEALNTEFGSTSKYGYGVANSGGESGALYFVNNRTNAAGSIPLPGVPSTSNNDIRAPYSGLQLSNDINEVNVSGGAQTQVLNSVPDCTSFYMLNKNQNAMAIQSSVDATTLDQTQAGLRQGTAFIGVEINFNQLNAGLEGLTVSDYPLLMYPVYLQYRSFGGGDNWVAATDIEGKPINFGGSQINRTGFDSRGSIGSAGIINQRNLPFYFNSSRVNSSSFTTNIGYNPQTLAYDGSDCLEANTQVKALNGDIRNTIARKTFVIGKSPYSGIASKFGDYRIIVRYPWGIKSSNGSSDPIVVGYGSNECPESGFNIVSGLVNANVFFGDFYYPAAYGGNNIYSYQYRVSNTAANTAQIASTQSINQFLYAREWHMKYVSKFYMNADLTQEWVPDNAGWFAYTAGSNDTSINATYGTDYSNTSSTGNPGLTQNIHRKWVAYFDYTGLKSLANSNYPSLAMEYQGW